MAEKAYVGKYSEALRRLQALDAAGAGQPVGPMGPGPATGAFQTQGVPSGLNPAYAPDPRMPAFQQAAQAQPLPTGGVLGGSEEKQPSALKGEEVKKPPQSLHQIVSGLDKDEREELRVGIRKQTGRSVDDLYAEFVKSGEIAPPAERKPRAKERLSVVAEALFRYMAHAGRGMDPGAASAMATLETQGRRGALEQNEIDEENARAEGRRGEVQGVLAARSARDQKKADTQDERGWEAGKLDAQAQNARDLQAQQDKAAMARTQVNEKSQREQRDPAMRQDPGTGEWFEYNRETETWEPAMSNRPVTKKGPRGVTTTVVDRVPFVTKPKEQGALTDASRQKMISDAVAAIQKDPRAMSRIRAQVGDDPTAIVAEVTRQAAALTEQQLAAGSNLDGGGYGENPLD